MKYIIRNLFLFVVMTVLSTSVFSDAINNLKAQYDSEWCGNGMLAIWNKARNGDNWESLSQIEQTQILDLEKISIATYKVRRDSELLRRDAEIKLTFKQELKLREFAADVHDAIYVRLFRDSESLSTFNELQILEINELLPEELIDIDKLKKLGLI
tara:strand:- start:313 stop:780 length:468 start_codon:yes stop_codon:yes gene_type:complete